MILDTRHWRLVHCEARPGIWNMAIDEAILEATGREEVLPTLRLYRWSPPCLSLGYAQPAADVDIEELAHQGWDVVRRPTGGRAILHTDELTYAVIAPPGESRLAGSVLESYQRLAQALLYALRLLGLPAQANDEYPQDNPAPFNRPVCFERPSNYEITAAGKKLMGSAQARRREGVLQHGSLPLSGDLTRITRALRFENEAARQKAAARLLERAATVETVLARPVSWDEAAAAFEEGFKTELNITFQRCELTAEEMKRAAELVEEKFGNPAWTQRI